MPTILNLRYPHSKSHGMRVASFSGSPLHAPMKKCEEEPGKYYMMVDIGQLSVLPHNSQMLMDTTPHTFSPRLLIAHRPRTPGTIFLHDLHMSTIAHSGRCLSAFCSLDDSIVNQSVNTRLKRQHIPPFHRLLT